MKESNDRKDSFELISDSDRAELIETYRRSLSYSLANKAAGDSRPQTQLDIDEARAAILRLMQLQGLAPTAEDTQRLRILVDSEPPRAYVTLDGQPITDTITPCFVDLYAGSGTHIISLSLPGFASLDQERVHCQVIQDAEGRRRLMVGADSTELRFAEAPVIKFRFRRNRVSVLVKTVPEIPGAEISIRGIEEHNRGIVIEDARADDQGRIELTDVTGEQAQAGSAQYRPLPSGTYLVEGRWRPFFGLFAQFSTPRSQTRVLPGDATWQELDVHFTPAAPFALWRAFLISGPITWLRRSKPIHALRSLPAPRRRRLLRRLGLVALVVLPALWLLRDWLTATTPPPGMVLVPGKALAEVRFDDPISRNLRTWLSDSGSSVWGNVLGSIAIEPRVKPLERFAIDRYEVTVREYIDFLDIGYHAVQVEPKGVDRWEEFPELPITGINWYAAKEYCEAQGKRLPTAAEWQAAAGGGVPDAGDRIPLFPWGDEFDSSRCNVKESPFRGLLPATSEELCPTDALETTLDTGRPVRCWSRFGVCSMVGNAAEWVDEHRVDIRGQIVEEALDDQRTVRRQEFSLRRNYAFMGGSFLDPGRLMGMVFARTYADPAISRPPVGIRCATSLSGDEDPPTGMVALGPFEQARNGPPQLAYVEPLRGLGQEEAARVLGQTLELLLATRRNASPNDFFLDLRPVSEQAYQDFIRRTRGRPGRWSHPRQPREKTSHAVGITQGAPEDAIDYVDWWDAYAYCRWRGMRLPSRVELEIAYSGGTNSLYPWGDAYAPRRLLEYESPYAVEGLVARFSEWTADYHRSLLVQGDKPRIIRGGILDSEATQKLFSMSAFMGYADAGDASSAFRCASDKRASIIERLAAKARSMQIKDPALAAD